MPQPIKKTRTVKPKPKPKNTIGDKKKKKHPEYGTSKLEDRFAREFLDRLGLKYIYQFKAESIGRYYDFRIEPRGPIIEIQGSYWHGDKRLYEEEDLNKTQKRNIKVDEKKKKWCEMNGIDLIYVWEKDINENPEKVMRFLRLRLKKFLPETKKKK